MHADRLPWVPLPLPQTFPPTSSEAPRPFPQQLRQRQHLLANSFCAYLPEEQQQQQHLGISNCCSDTKVSFGNWQSGTKVDGQSRGKAGVENMPSPLSVHFCEGVCNITGSNISSSNISSSSSSNNSFQDKWGKWVTWLELPYRWRRLYIRFWWNLNIDGEYLIGRNNLRVFGNSL